MNCSKALDPPKEHGGLNTLGLFWGAIRKISFVDVAVGVAGSSVGQSPNKIKFNDSGTITVQIWNMIQPTVNLCAS